MKRIIAILLFLSLVLAGCQNKEGIDETDQTSNENAQNETTESSDTDAESSDTEKESNNLEVSDPETLLLELNQAWSLIRTVELENPVYEIPVYHAAVEAYHIAKDLSNIENINQFAGFTDKQVSMLVNNGFIALPSTDSRMYYVYDDNEYKGVPNFISSDTVLHLYHQFYDKSLMSIESNYLYQDLDLMTSQMLSKSLLLDTLLTDSKLKELQKNNIIYFMVARMLILQSQEIAVSVDADHQYLLDAARQEYELVQAAEGVTESPLFGEELDYSQFTVRGHYTRTEELSRYFRAMMWLGYAPLGFVNNEGVILYDNVLQALLITYTTITDLKNSVRESKPTSDAKLWSDIYQPTAQYVGLSDDINVFTMNGLRLDIFGEDENPDIYNDEEFHDALTDAVKALPEPQIQGEIIQTSQVTGKQFRFMGQRYVLDSDILQTLMKPILRPIPTALDVMGVFGSKTAEELLFKVYKPQDTWPEYTEKYQELKAEVVGYDENYWKKNLYTGWLSALKEELIEYKPSSGMPLFMTTDAWRNKSLNTALSSYAELKHDTVLYGKQAMAEMGGPVATAELHYVEPKIELYYKLLYLTEFTCKVLDEKGMLNEYLKEGSSRYTELLSLLIDCSVKELRNEPLTAEENQQLLWSGGTMETIMMNFLIGATDDFSTKDPTDMLITDIATGGDSYLSIGTGYFDHIYVVIPYDGKLYLSRGSVYSFYEFTSDKRLTDEAWWELQGIKVVHEDFGDYAEYGEPSSILPEQPDFIRSFKSDTNDVIITSLEVLWDLLEE